MLNLFQFIRLPLILIENVDYEEFEEKCEIANASRCWEFQDGMVVIIELPNRDHEMAHGVFIRQFMYQDPQFTLYWSGSTSMCFSVVCECILLY